MTAVRPVVASPDLDDDAPGATWRVWAREWLFAHRARTRADAVEWAREKYQGKLQPDEVRLRRDDEGGTETWVVSALLWNVRAEWKTEEQAAGYAREFVAAPCEVAQVGSRAERRLRGVGQLMIPSSEYRPWTEEDPRESPA